MMEGVLPRFDGCGGKPSPPSSCLVSGERALPDVLQRGLFDCGYVGDLEDRFGRDLHPPYRLLIPRHAAETLATST